jgi:tRNA U55 pseudouridine synthase TruB
MTELKRTKSGSFEIESSFEISQLEAMDFEKRCSLLTPVEELFSEAEAVTLPDFYARLCKSGCEIYQKKIKTDFPPDTFVRIYDNDGFFALGQVKEYPDGSAIKAIKLFVI